MANDVITKGSRHTMKNNGVLVVNSYNGYKSVDVTFVDTGYQTTTHASQIRLGTVKDNLLPSRCGVGFVGDGIYKTRVDGRKTKAYISWSNMINRCYVSSGNHSVYSDCEVCEEWQDFQNFAQWFEENYPDDGNEYDLDKDLKVDGNRIYSPETCKFVSKSENSEKAKAKSYTLISPEGSKVSVYNMAKFCRENNLTQQCMSSVALGLIYQHKGWSLYNE